MPHLGRHDGTAAEDAAHTQPLQRRELAAAFDFWDVDGSGAITARDLRLGLSAFGKLYGQYDALISALRSDHGISVSARPLQHRVRERVYSGSACSDSVDSVSDSALCSVGAPDWRRLGRDADLGAVL